MSIAGNAGGDIVGEIISVDASPLFPLFQSWSTTTNSVKSPIVFHEIPS